MRAASAPKDWDVKAKASETAHEYFVTFRERQSIPSGVCKSSMNAKQRFRARKGSCGFSLYEERDCRTYDAFPSRVLTREAKLSTLDGCKARICEELRAHAIRA
jgi:hypothetical protein